MENISDSKLLPYGMMNFAVIRRDDYYYVDKTAFIPLIERSDRFFFFIISGVCFQFFENTGQFCLWNSLK